MGILDAGKDDEGTSLAVIFASLEGDDFEDGSKIAVKRSVSAADPGQGGDFG